MDTVKNTILIGQFINEYLPPFLIILGITVIVMTTNIIIIRKLRKKNKSNLLNFNIAIDSANLIIVKIDQLGNIISFNNNFAKMFQFTYNEHAKSLAELFDDNHKNNFYDLIQLIIRNNVIQNYEVTLVNKDNKEYNILFTATNNDFDTTNEVELIGFDISKRVELEHELKVSKNELLRKNVILEQNQIKLLENEKKIWSLAYIDHLTGLYNRAYFVEKCNDILKENTIYGALVLIDVDNIGHCNNIYGPNKTDEILKDISKRINKMSSHKHLVAKLGSDEFAILINNSTLEEIKDLSEQIVQMSAYNVTHEGVTLHISVSAGVAFFPEHGDNYENLMKTASLALKNAKDNGKEQYILYDESMEKKLVNKMNIEALIREGLDQNRFFLVYQPQYNMNTGEISGFEALLRLQDEEGNIIPPNNFIGIAEETKLIIPLGYWVIHQACEFILRLEDRGIHHLTVSINVSVVQILQDDFVVNIKNILNSYDVNPQNFEIEITETSLMNFSSRNIEKINDLRSFGINIALDDFGTGYSSLLYFKKTTNISIIKIDREFVKDITLSQNNVEIVDAIIYLAHKFNFKVVAEGVETSEQYGILSQLGCDSMQGYLGSKPIIESNIYEGYNSLLNIKNKLH